MEKVEDGELNYYFASKIKVQGKGILVAWELQLTTKKKMRNRSPIAIRNSLRLIPKKMPPPDFFSGAAAAAAAGAVVVCGAGKGEFETWRSMKNHTTYNTM